MNRKLLQATVLVILFLNIVATSYTLFLTEQSLIIATARVSREATVQFCFNRPPSFSVPCSTNLSQGTTFTCQLNATDPDNGVITYSQTPVAPDNASLFTINSSGYINFTPDNDDVGNHSVILTIDDNAGCTDSQLSYIFNYTVGNLNDAPVLDSNLPDQNFTVNTTLVAFFLTDYFSDPDGDTLNFTFVRDVSSIQINITINNDSSVEFESNDCGSAFFRFFATDPDGLQAQSNLIEVESECPTASSGGGSSSSSSGGGGGGGGGGGALSICRPELVCLPWSACYPNGLQVQVCRDKNGCNDGVQFEDRQEIKFYRNCTYAGEEILCQENWLCSDWSVCSMNQVQNRSCIDLEECGTTYFQPNLEQECNYLPTCFDGVQNGDETGIDCGGRCAACRQIQQPSVFDDAAFPTLWALILILLLSILLSLAVLYREKLYENLARLGWLMVRRRKKEILLTPSEKKVIFEAITSLEQEIKERKLGPQASYDKIASIVRKYYSFAIDIPPEFTLEEFSQAFQKRKLSEEIKSVLFTFIARLTFIEHPKTPVHLLGPQLLTVIKEELRLITCMTSEYTMREIERDLATRDITDALSYMEEIWVRLVNSFEALQFQRSDLAREEYVRILQAYENLTADQKTEMYPAVNRLFFEIKYSVEIEG